MPVTLFTGPCVSDHAWQTCYLQCVLVKSYIAFQSHYCSSFGELSVHELKMLISFPGIVERSNDRAQAALRTRTHIAVAFFLGRVHCLDGTAVKLPVDRQCLWLSVVPKISSAPPTTEMLAAYMSL